MEDVNNIRRVSQGLYSTRRCERQWEKPPTRGAREMDYAFEDTAKANGVVDIGFSAEKLMHST